jgi:hypothetical protein
MKPPVSAEELKRRREALENAVTASRLKAWRLLPRSRARDAPAESVAKHEVERPDLRQFVARHLAKRDLGKVLFTRHTSFGTSPPSFREPET